MTSPRYSATLAPSTAPLLLLDTTALSSEALPSKNAQDALSGLRLLKDIGLVQQSIIPDQVLYETTGLLPSSVPYLFGTLRNLAPSKSLFEEDPSEEDTNNLIHGAAHNSEARKFLRAIAEGSPRTGTHDRIAAHLGGLQSVLHYVARDGFTASGQYRGSTKTGARFARYVQDELEVATGMGTPSNGLYTLSLEDVLWQASSLPEAERNEKLWDKLEKLRIPARFSMHMGLVSDSELNGNAHAEQGKKAKATKKAYNRERRRPNGVERYLTQEEVLFDCGHLVPAQRIDGANNGGRQIIHPDNKAVRQFLDQRNLKADKSATIASGGAAASTSQSDKNESKLADLQFLRQAMGIKKTDFHALLREHAGYRKFTLGDAFHAKLIDADALEHVAQILGFPAPGETAIATFSDGKAALKCYKSLLRDQGFFEQPLTLELIATLHNQRNETQLGPSFAKYLAPFVSTQKEAFFSYHRETFDAACAANAHPAETVHYEQLFAHAVDTGMISLQQCMEIAVAAGLAQKVPNYQNIYSVASRFPNADSKLPTLWVNTETGTVTIPKTGSGLHHRKDGEDPLFGKKEWIPKTSVAKPASTRRTRLDPTNGEKATGQYAVQTELFDAPLTGSILQDSGSSIADHTLANQGIQTSFLSPPTPAHPPAEGNTKQVIHLKQGLLCCQRKDYDPEEGASEASTGGLSKNTAWKAQHATAMEFLEALLSPPVLEGRAHTLAGAGEAVLGKAWMTQLHYNFAASHLNQALRPQKENTHPGQNRMAASGEAIYTMQREVGDLALMELAGRSCEIPSIIVANENGIRDSIAARNLTPFFQRVRSDYRREAAIDIAHDGITVSHPDELGITLAAIGLYTTPIASNEERYGHGRERQEQWRARISQEISQKLRSSMVSAYPILETKAMANPHNRYRHEAKELMDEGVIPNYAGSLLARLLPNLPGATHSKSADAGR